MYKCVDQRGTAQYSDKPSPDCVSREVDIEPIPPVWGKVMPYKEDLKAAERAFQQRRIQREREFDAERRRLADLMRRHSGSATSSPPPKWVSSVMGG